MGSDALGIYVLVFAVCTILALVCGLGLPSAAPRFFAHSDYLIDLPARDMIEYGHILPEPGDEQAWMDGLPETDRLRTQKTGA